MRISDADADADRMREPAIPAFRIPIKNKISKLQPF